jgi:succinate dehydrogenase / fumarate reductase membrane anchor subunit
MTKSSFRTPLGRVRFLGPARQGAVEAARQRLTAVALAPLAIGFVWLVLSLLPKDYNAARAKMGQPLNTLVILLFVLVGVYHMQIGMRSVISDYLGGRAREWGLILNALVAGALGVVCVYAALRISFV